MSRIKEVKVLYPAQYTLFELIVFGYTRENCQHLVVPKEIIDTCLLYLLDLYEHLVFSDEYRSTGIELHDNGRYATKKLGNSACVWAVADIEPVKTGIHCWRIHTINAKWLWFLWGISKKKAYPDSAYSDPTVYGMSNSWFTPDGHKAHTTQSRKYLVKDVCDIDMCLDATKGNIKWRMLGNDGSDTIKMWNLPQFAWVPHFEWGMHSAATQSIRIVKIPNQWFGQKKDIKWDSK